MTNTSQEQLNDEHTMNMTEILKDLEYRDLYCAFEQNSMTTANNYLYNYLYNFIYSTYIEGETTYEELVDYVKQAKDYIDINVHDMYNSDHSTALAYAFSCCKDAELLKLLHTELDLSLEDATEVNIEKDILISETELYKKLAELNIDYEEDDNIIYLTALQLASIYQNVEAIEYIIKNTGNI